MTNEEIEKVARAICVELGIDPEEQVGHGFGANFTPADWAEHKSDTIPAIALYSPQWALYRGQAALAIASAKAVSALAEPRKHHN